MGNILQCFSPQIFEFQDIWCRYSQIYHVQFTSYETQISLESINCILKYLFIPYEFSPN